MIHMRAEPIEELVWNEVVKILESPEMVTSRLMPRVEGPDRDRLLAEVKSAKTDLQRIESEEDRLIRLLVSGKITEPQFDRQRKFIVKRLETARGFVASARGRLETIEKAADLEDAVKAWTDQLKLGVELLTGAERQQLLRLMVHRVTVSADADINLVLAVSVDSLIANEKLAS